MELTISQIGSASTHWVPRTPLAATGPVRMPVSTTPASLQGVSAVAASTLDDMETEYDQFGRFGANAAAAAERAAPGKDAAFERPIAATPRPDTNPSKSFRSGKATVLELEREYAQSIVGSYVDPDGANVERSFIPFGMTEYQVYQLQDYQYRWMIQLERQAALAKLIADTSKF